MLRIFALAVCTSGLILVTTLQTGARADEAAYQRAMADAVRAAANHVLPSVVMIEIVGTTQNADGEVEQDAPTSGVIVDAEGYVIASSIVAEKPSASLLVLMPDGSRQTAKVVARDQHRDLVLLKINADAPVQAIALPKNISPIVGQTLISVGRYGGDAAPMVSTGIFSAGGRLDGIALQTDARVPPAMYGGPLVDLYGNFLGVIIPAVAEGGAEDATSWYDSGIAFAIPADVIAAKLDRLKNGQDIKKGVIGIVGKSRDLNDNTTEIAAVRTRSPAEAAGIKAGDDVLSVAGTPVSRHQEIRQVLGAFDAGEQVAIKLRRGDEELEVNVTLADSIPPLQPQRLGIVASQTDGVVTVDTIVPGSPADEKIQAGDVIAAIGSTKIDAVDLLRRQMISAVPSEPIQVKLLRGEETLTVEVVPQSIAGPLPTGVSEAWQTPSKKPWTAEEIKLPESANQAAFTAPPKDSELQNLGLIVLLLGPGEGSPMDVAKQWTDAARAAGTVVCVIAPESDNRWQPKELEIVASFAAAVIKKAAINPVAVAVGSAGGVTAGELAGGKATAADAMALASAISQSKTFFGVVVASETRAPAMRLRENEPAASLEILLPVESNEELPAWAAGISAAGYPVVLGGDIDEAAMLAWVRRLQSI